MARPNILQIVVDDMGYGDFGLFNGGLCQTPTLDHLAKNGLCFTQHYSGSAVCAPARAALLTGRYPHRTGAIDTLEGRGLDRLALRERTIGDLLQAQGYTTGLIGKWHNGALDPRYHPNRRGFDEFVGFRGGWQDYYQWRLDANGTARESDGRYLTDVFTEEAAGFIRRHRGEPWFLHLAYNAPHFPLQAPEQEIQPYRESGPFTEGVARIYAMIRRVDRGVEQLLDLLEKLGLAENTLVMFTSDNGPQFGGEGDMCTTRYNCGYAGAKGVVYEGGIRVPMILRWPAGLPEDGRWNGETIHYCDWLPTLMHAVGAEPPRDLALDGVDALDAIRGEATLADKPRFWQWNRYTPVGASNAAMRDGDWKLVRPRLAASMWLTEADLAMDCELKYEPDKHDEIARTPEPEREIPAPPPPELYNLAHDPMERRNLAKAEPQRTARMLRKLETWFEEVEAERRSIEDVW
ncbi:MAG: sulfatase-like hydrolase/transferase [Anaerolineae bacterium]